MVEKLLKAGADAKCAGDRRRDPAHDRGADRQCRRRRVLLAHGAAVDARESWRGQTALMWAAAQNHPVDGPRAARARRRRQRALCGSELGTTEYQGASRKVAVAGRPHAVAVCCPSGIARVRADARRDWSRRQPDRSGGDERRAVGHHQRPLRRRRFSAR